MALLQVAVALLIAGLAYAVYQFRFSRLSAFPGPFGSQLTDIPRAIATVTGRIDDIHRNWHKRYGTAVRMGPNMISISDPNMIKVIYATKTAWTKSEMYVPNDVLIGKQRMSNMFNTRDNAWHDKIARPIRGFFSMTKVLEIEPYIDETLNLLVEKLDAKFVKGDKFCMMDDWMAYFAWDVTANLTFGRHYGFIEQEKDVNNLIVDSAKGLYYFAPVSQIPWIDYLLDKNPFCRIGPKPTLTGVMYAFGVVAQYQKDLKEKGAANEKHVDHYLDRYLKLRQEYPDMVDDNQIVNWLMLNVLAGGDTTSSTMRAVLYYIAKNPKCYQHLIDELDQAKLSLPAQWREVQNLSYLDAVIRESIRYNPGIAMVFERDVPEPGFSLPDGRFIPGGTKIGINPAVTNRDSEVFGADADDWNADRWLQKEGEGKEEFTQRVQRMKDVSEFTFGAGNRVCLGKNLARLEMYKLFATLYSLFDIKLVNSEHKWKYHDAWFVYQYDMPMTISRRSRS